MNKIKTLILFAFSAMLFACGSQDGSPPELKSKQLGTISPFDTLIAVFDSEIVGVGDLVRENISAESYVNWRPINRESLTKESLCYSKKTLCFVGNNKTYGGAFYFDEGVENDSIVFLNLKNSDGTRKRTTLRYSTHKIFDEEPNNKEADANDMKLFGDANDMELFGKVTDGVHFAGILDKEIGIDEDGFAKHDIEDYYKLYLAEGDSIYIKASNQGSPFSFVFYGPCPRPSSGCNRDSIYVNKKIDSLQTVVKGGYLPIGSTVGTPGTFYIKVVDKNIAAPPTPYLITVKVTK